jgi:hypothetical protein
MFSLLGGIVVKDLLVLHLLLPLVFPKGIFPSADEKLGLEEAMKTKAYMIPATRWTSPSLHASDKLGHALFMAGVYTLFRIQKKPIKEAVRLALMVGLLVEGWESTEKLFNYGSGEWDFSRWDLFANALGVLWASTMDRELKKFKIKNDFKPIIKVRFRKEEKSKNILTITREEKVFFHLKS